MGRRDSASAERQRRSSYARSRRTARVHRSRRRFFDVLREHAKNRGKRHKNHRKRQPTRSRLVLCTGDTPRGKTTTGKAVVKHDW